jgi:hypothetical protein
MKFVKPAMVLAFGGITSYVGYGLLYGNENLYSNFVMPTIQKLMDGEQAHNFAISLAKYKLVPYSAKFKDEQILVNFFRCRCFKTF